MSDYNPPIEDMQFLLHDVMGFRHDELDRETCEAVLSEAAKLASGVLAPINVSGDQHGAKLNTNTNEVTTAPGWQDAYAQYRDGGWNSVPFDPEFGGQGMPLCAGLSNPGNVARGEHVLWPVPAVEPRRGGSNFRSWLG